MIQQVEDRREPLQARNGVGREPELDMRETLSLLLASVKAMSSPFSLNILYRQPTQLTFG